MHCFVLLFIDLVLIAASTLGAISLCSTDALLSALAAAGDYGVFTLAAAVPVILRFGLNRTVWRFTSLGDSVSITMAVVAIIALATCLGLIFDRLAGVPRTLPVIQGLLMLHALVGVRVAMRIRHDMRRRARRYQSSVGAKRENVLLVGLNPLADLFLSCAAENGHGRVDIVGILSEDERHRGRVLRSQKIIGPPEAIREALHDLAVHGVFVDRIVMASPSSELSANARAALLDLQRSGTVRIDYLSPRYGLTDDSLADREIATNTSFEAAEPLTNSYLRWKRLIDAVVSLVGLVSLVPLMLVVFVAVRLDVGAPAIFWQQRPGARGRPIRVLKFRTMGPARDRNGHPVSDMERVSKLGRLLRRLRLDELPQVYNVLLGHMSLVGPRPLLPIDQPSAPAARLQLRPGLTGWAQIKGGRHLSNEDKAALDLWYIKHASFALDMMIIAHTVRMVLFGERVDQNAIHEAWQALRDDKTPLLPVDGPGHSRI